MPLTKKAERTKAKLTASARKLISERGFDNVSVEEITKDAGVAKGTFYHYFVCKEDVVREFSTRVIEEQNVGYHHLNDADDFTHRQSLAPETCH
jgi:AcrR family transcriptional regulator